MDLSWIDFTRRNDPAHKKGVKLLKENLNEYGYPKVLCFWTKAPDLIYKLYKNIIKDMQDNDTLVLMQTTINKYDEMENISDNVIRLDRIKKLLGDPEYIRVRFDPIIGGYTTPQHFLDILDIVVEHNIKRIITNFLVPSYKDINEVLEKEGFTDIYSPSQKKKIKILKWMRKKTPNDIDIAVCAETYKLANKLDGILPPACSDPQWAINIKPELEGSFTKNPSRNGCGCCYSGDWGKYYNSGGYKCPFNCLYCYAK